VPRKCNANDVDHAVQLYLGAKPVKEIPPASGVSLTILYRELARRGIPSPSLPANVIAAYVAGESEFSISQRLGIARNVIRRVLERHGVHVRSSSEAGLVRASKMDPESRQAQSAAAHDAVRGTSPSPAMLVERAHRREVKGRFHSEAEATMFGWLTERGLEPIPQKAIGKYSVDLAVHPIAVEILGGGWHAYKPMYSIRTPYILNVGWHLAFVWDFEGRSALTEHAADSVVAFLDEVRRHPPTVGQYRVIAGDGELLATGGADDREFALKPPPRGRKR
jgi:hypothetical protein